MASGADTRFRSGPARGHALAPVLALGIATALAAALAPPARAVVPVADSLEGRFVRRIDVDAREIFDPVPGGRFRSAYAIANRLHVRTRASTIRSALVLRPGDRWSAARGAESERRLRSLGFVLPDSVVVTPVPGAPDSVDVRVRTHDTWTTSPEVTFESTGDERYGSFAFTERNLLGRGLELSAVHREDPAGVSRYVSVADDDIAGTHWGARFVAGNGDVGKNNLVELDLPFRSEESTRAMGVSWRRNVTLAQLYETDAIAARVPLSEEVARAWWGVGRRAADGTVQRFVVTFRARDHRLGATRLEPGAPGEFAGGEEELRLRRFEGEMTLWKPRFVVRRGVDFMDRDEDFDLGSLLLVGMGVAPRGLGSDADEGWLHGRLAAGAQPGASSFGLADAEVRTRVRSGLRETFAQFRARWVLQPRRTATLVTAVSGAAGRRMTRDFQLRTGALTGLRGFGADALAGTQLWRGNAEVRWTARRDVLQLVTLGAATFWDSARAYGPGSGGKSWHHDAGFGLRLSLPHSSRSAVARFDVAWPVAPRLDGRRGPAYSLGTGQAF